MRIPIAVGRDTRVRHKRNSLIVWEAERKWYMRESWHFVGGKHWRGW